MKKLLACLLIATLLLGGSAIGASAALAEPDPAIFILPTVVAIEAQLRSDVEPITFRDGWLFLSPYDIDIIVHFEDGTSRLLKYEWRGRTYDTWWGISWEFDHETHIVTIFYHDSNSVGLQTTLDLSDVEFVELEWTTPQPDDLGWFWTSPWAIPLRVLAFPFITLVWSLFFLPIFFTVLVFGWPASPW